MFCNSCGRNVPDGTRFCPYCGKTIGAAAPAYRPATPVGYAPAYRSAPAMKPSIYALLSMILGITGAFLGLLFSIISIILLANRFSYFYGVGGLFIAFGVAIGLCASGAGLAYSIVAKKKGDRTPFSLVGLICGACGAGLCFFAFIFLLVVAARTGF